MKSFIKWSVWDLIKWKSFPGTAGGVTYIQRFKDSWVKYNQSNIRNEVATCNIPPELLAGVAWIEVGGDPTIVDYIAFYIRDFDWSGPTWIDQHMTITNHPSKTSFGAVSMQLRVAAETLGLNPKTLSLEQQRDLIKLLDSDVHNLRLVSKHLSNLLKHAFPKINTSHLTDEQIKIVGARYNRGTGISLEALRRNTSYGDFLLKNKQRIYKLLS